MNFCCIGSSVESNQTVVADWYMLNNANRYFLKNQKQKFSIGLQHLTVPAQLAGMKSFISLDHICMTSFINIGYNMQIGHNDAKQRKHTCSVGGSGGGLVPRYRGAGR